MTSDELAIHGGEPARRRDWPLWPRADLNTARLLLEVLRSGRWTISGPYTGRICYERQFAAAFADFHGLRYCVPTASGSSALSICLEALGVGHGDEVLVPGLTWVACASAVVALGAVPILVDVDPDTLCMSVDAARVAVTSRSRAILVVHLYSAIADIEGFCGLSEDAGIPLLEDCSQAHGAIWHGKRVGTFGRAAAFSMQQTKLLTSGEGGAAITDDAEVYDVLQQLRADGRRYADREPAPGLMELEEVGAVLGRNMCLSEFHAAVLLDRLAHLDEENKTRQRTGLYLSERLAGLGGIVPVCACGDAVDLQTYYQYCVRIDRATFSGASVDQIARALTGELGVLVEPVDSPLNANVLYAPLRSARTPADPHIREQLDPTRFDLPEATKARAECLTIPHRVLLGTEADMEDVVHAFQKVRRHSRALT